MLITKMVRRATGLALIAILAFASAASAASTPSSITVTGHGMTLTVSGVRLLTTAAVSVNVDFRCSPLDENGTLVSTLTGGGQVTMTEAVGKQLATGTGQFGDIVPVTCDSITVNHFAVLVVSTTVPFKAGSGVIQSWVSASDENFCCTGDYYRYANIQGAIKIGR